MGRRPEILDIHTPTLFANAVRRAVDLLRAGQAVAMPTETVYGLAANALDPEAVARVFAAKGRPSHNPIIVHVASLCLARQSTSGWPDAADRLAAAFWPGPLTMVLPKAAAIPDLVTAGGSTVGIRWPRHPFFQAVLRECGFPLAAPSANASNRLSPTSAEHVRLSLGDRIPLIIDGGHCQVGIESTVIDLCSQPPRVLRPGMIDEPSLTAVLGRIGTGTAASIPTEPLRSPGQLDRHYAPRARLSVLAWTDDNDLRRQLAARGWREGECWAVAHSHIPEPGGLAGVSVIPHDAEAFARALYAELHRCDQAGARRIVVEAPPPAPEWHAITDRLRRGSADP